MEAFDTMIVIYRVFLDLNTQKTPCNVVVYTPVIIYDVNVFAMKWFIVNVMNNVTSN